MKLSPRELQVVKALIGGQSLKEVAGDLNINLGTLTADMGRLRKRLGYRTTEQMLCAIIVENLQLPQK